MIKISQNFKDSLAEPIDTTERGSPSIKNPHMNDRNYDEKYNPNNGSGYK